MRLEHMTWHEVDAKLGENPSIFLPTGSTEQHGPIGLIGTDTICADTIAQRAADIADAIVAPAIGYTPAPFNMGFPGTMSLSPTLFQAVVSELLSGLATQGFRNVYILNGHGGNLAPLRKSIEENPQINVRIRSWWDFDPVNQLRKKWYGDWEGMHATPSEVAITQALVRIVTHHEADTPPEKLSMEYIKAHAGDRHGPPDEHRRDFPDGRVGSHSALACPDHGAELISVAAKAIAEDYKEFCS
ncbi:creatininase family protein [Cochlodiniinecator piscidefendens]|uniref:creatininase family protein n=1 Tax=Cochlodiniinecator piscidefendens TaxID=2715756 RepID=UPI00140B31B4|nr:creatininase family protein [Cochlodiniinecator piscidefendens]